MINTIKGFRKEVKIFLVVLLLFAILMYISSFDNNSNNVGYVDEYPFLDKVFK